MKSTLNYSQLYEEVERYNVDLPETPDVIDLSDINKRYALAQAALTRVSNIERQAIMNCNMWSKYKSRLQEYIETKKSKYLVEGDIVKLPNTTLQQAEVRNKMSKAYSLLARIGEGLSESVSFREIIENKKKDLASVIMNLSRQVKVLSLESNLMR
jgi:hypothetical protein